MPKLKTRKSAQKRIKVTGRDKVLRKDLRMSHLKTKKTSKRLRRKSGTREIAVPEVKRLKKMLPQVS